MMPGLKQFTTIKSSSEYVYKEKSSEFIGKAFPVESEEDFHKLLTSVKKEYYDASHHCYAVKLVDFTKYSDDGEPAGTAGVRILNAIDHFGLHNILVVIVRYFGGTKLGVGPLGKAYYYTAEKVLEQTELEIKKAYQQVIIKCDAAFVSTVHRIALQHKVKNLKTDYDQILTFNCFVLPGQLEEMKKKLSESSKGSILVETAPEILFL